MNVVRTGSNVISIEGYDFIKLDMRGLKYAVKYKHKKSQYTNFVSLIMVILFSEKYEVYLPIPRKYPKFIYKLFRKTIILDSILFQFNGGSIGFHETFHPFLFKNNKFLYKKISNFGFYDFSILNYME
ncbi:hypothetical protein D7X33_19125 [Butyricicoccus sp. 1XD8-22]|nr:hypothetical protein D7X33_19125 [Butyricicoccus sp. 1XD8-22]